jgi:hypothetical protein
MRHHAFGLPPASNAAMILKWIELGTGHFFSTRTLAATRYWLSDVPFTQVERQLDRFAAFGCRWR